MIRDPYLIHLRRALRSLQAGQMANAIIAARQALNAFPKGRAAQMVLDEATQAYRQTSE